MEGSVRGNKDPMGFVSLGAASERREGGKEDGNLESNWTFLEYLLSFECG